MDTCICMAEYFHCLPETITALLTDCTPIQNKMLNKPIKQKSQYGLEKEQVGGLKLPDFNNYYKVTETRQCDVGIKMGKYIN